MHVRYGLLESPTASGGAGIRVENGTLSVNNSIINRNDLSATSNGGGGILARNSTVEITESDIFDNSSSAYPDRSVKPSGSAMLAINSIVTIVRSRLSENFGYGEIHSLVFDNSVATIDQSYLEGSASQVMGHIELRNDSSLSCINSTLASATTSETVIDIEDSEISFLNCTVIDQYIQHDSNSVRTFTNTIFTNDCFPLNFAAHGTTNFFSRSTCTGISSPGDLLLFPADDNGGPTPTAALSHFSDVIGAGGNTSCPVTDQRGELRNDGGCDIGAFEFIADADVQISVVPAIAGPYYAGQSIELNINLYNAGPDAANLVRVDASFDHLNVQSIEGICTSLPCEIEELAAGAPPQTITIAATIISNGLDNYGATATVSKSPLAHYTELNVANNVSSITRNLVDVAELSITKTKLTPPPHFIGQSIVHRIVVHNAGPDIAANVVVTETPGNLSITSITNCAGPTAGPCTFPSIAVGASRTLDVTSTIDSAFFRNEASVAADTAETNLDDNIDNLGNGGSAQTDADLQATLTLVTFAPWYSGQIVEYQMSVTNNGPDIATHVTLNVDSENLFIVGVIGSCGIDVLPCQVGNVAVGATVSRTIQAQVNHDGPAFMHLTVESDQTDANLANNESSKGFLAQQSAEIQVSLSLLTPPPHYPGQRLHYRMITTNGGDDNATGVEPEISPTNLDIVSVIGGQCFELPCDIPILGILQSETIDIIATPRLPGPFDMDARAYASQFDWNLANNLVSDIGGVAEPSLDDRIFADAFETIEPD
ncbi:MAG TPA: DUF11 domain-containing protein [Dokdonella sp.]|uniref:DUF11 domain-containing protein n=1 Tax=Dokdonella sp. TaxID=2291710 RepID=UPI002D802CD5|nr:DUF11 domain-containing protein [Dokdonella sp.]HET9031381.1 DUF11 domain-containing protein [Dokdonella sp.]